MNRRWTAGLLAAGAACGPLPPEIGASGDASEPVTMTAPPGDPTTTGDPTTGDPPPGGTTEVAAECDDDLDCGECGYCFQGQCEGGDFGCCGEVPDSAGGVELRCQPPEESCSGDAECPEGTICTHDGCEFVDTIGECERVAFAEAALPLAAVPGSLLLLDLELDGDLDLVAVSADGAAVELLLGDGTGALVSAGSFPTGLAGAGATVAAADFDLDGALDLALLRPGADAALSLLLGQAGVLGPPAITTVDAASTGLLAGRFDADEHADVLLTLDGSPPLLLLPGDGAGGLGPPAMQTDLFGALPPTAAGDLDGDGNLELVAAFANDASVQLLDHAPDLGFASIRAYLTPGITPQRRALLGDLDGDGAPEIIGTRGINGVGLVDVWRTLDPHASPPRDAVAVPEAIVGLHLGELDGEPGGEVIALADSSQALRLVFGKPFGELACSQGVALPEPTAAPRIAAGDLDGDGRTELVVGGFVGASVRVLTPTPL